MGELVSVIIPVYNREKYIGDCLKSLYNQTYENMEILVIDDGSDDHTLDICKSCMEQDKRIILFLQNHCGVSEARNFGIQEAKGDYIVFLDSDDMLHPCFVSSFLNRLKRTHAEIATCFYLKAPTEKMQQCYKKMSLHPVEKWSSLSPEDVMNQFHSEDCKYLGVVTCKLIKSDFIKNVRFRNNLRFGEDTLYMYDLVRKGFSMDVLDDAWYLYRMHDNNTVSPLNILYQDDTTEVYRTIAINELKENHPANVRKWWRMYFGMQAKKYRIAVKKGKKDMREKLWKDYFNTSIPQEFLWIKCRYTIAMLFPRCWDVLATMKEKAMGIRK